MASHAPAHLPPATPAVSPILLALPAAAGCLAVEMQVHALGMPPVLASSAVGVVAAAATILGRAPGYCAAAAFGASFTGMGRIPESAYHLAGVTFLTAIASIVVAGFFLSQARWPERLLPGCGGRLGAAGFASFSLFALGCHDIHTGWRVGAVTPTAILATFAAVLAGAAVTVQLRRRLPRDTVAYNVGASALVGIAGCLPTLMGVGGGAKMAAGVYLGSFIGMTDLGLLTPGLLLASSLIAAVAFAALGKVLDGWGGLLGTSALIGVAASRALLPSFYKAREFFHSWRRAARRALANPRRGAALTILGRSAE